MGHRELTIQLTVQGALIYAAMLAYLTAFVQFVVVGLVQRGSRAAGEPAAPSRARSAGRGFYVAGFVLALAAFIYRWQHVQHVPLQSMFEVFLCLGMLAFPLSVLYRRALGIGGRGGGRAGRVRHPVPGRVRLQPAAGAPAPGRCRAGCSCRTWRPTCWPTSSCSRPARRRWGTC